MDPFGKIRDYINQKNDLYNLLLDYIEVQDDDNKDFQILIEFIDNSEILKDKEEFKILLRLISKISKYHYRTSNFFNKIERILINYKENIKKTFTNPEILQLFKSSKRILLFLFNEKILIKDQEIILYLNQKGNKNGVKYCHFFYPEINEFYENSPQAQSIKKQLLQIDDNIFENFETNRQNGENEAYLCQLIRNDSVEDFISHITRNNLRLKSEIKNSIFETNSYLMKNQPITLIEYAAFYGSIQIFQYLRMNHVEMNPNLWAYVIHGGNAEMIHLLEESRVSTIFFGCYSKCLEAAIQFHNRNVVNYFNDNMIKEDYLVQEEANSYNENRLNYSFHSLYFPCFPKQFDNQFIFCYLCQYDYFNLVNLFVQTNTINVNEKIILNIRN